MSLRHGMRRAAGGGYVPFLFLDNFDGSGTLQNRVPDVGEPWAGAGTPYFTVSGGSVGPNENSTYRSVAVNAPLDINLTITADFKSQLATTGGHFELQFARTNTHWYRVVFISSARRVYIMSVLSSSPFTNTILTSTALSDNIAASFVITNNIALKSFQMTGYISYSSSSFSELINSVQLIKQISTDFTKAPRCSSLKVEEI